MLGWQIDNRGVYILQAVYRVLAFLTERNLVCVACSAFLEMLYRASIQAVNNLTDLMQAALQDLKEVI